MIFSGCHSVKWAPVNQNEYRSETVYGVSSSVSIYYSTPEERKLVLDFLKKSHGFQELKPYKQSEFSMLLAECGY